MGKKLLHSFCSKKIEIIEFLADDGIGSEVEGSSPLEYPDGQQISHILQNLNPKKKETIYSTVWEMIQNGKRFGVSTPIQMLTFIHTVSFLNQ